MLEMTYGGVPAVYKAIEREHDQIKWLKLAKYCICHNWLKSFIQLYKNQEQNTKFVSNVCLLAPGDFLPKIEKLFDDDRAIELPINIVVMLVVGMGSPL